MFALSCPLGTSSPHAWTKPQGVSDGKAVKLAGFGMFESVSTKARAGVNPATKQPLNIPSRRRVRFRTFKAFKEIVDPSFKKEVPDKEEAVE
jgi:Bacterial DNA-binding protein